MYNKKKKKKRVKSREILTISYVILYVHALNEPPPRASARRLSRVFDYIKILLSKSALVAMISRLTPYDQETVFRGAEATGGLICSYVISLIQSF